MSDKLPKWLIPLENDKYKVICKHGEYILEEKDGDTFEMCKTLADKMNGSVSFEKFLMMRSIIEPIVNETEFGKIIKGSDYIRLQFAISYVYGLEDFLPKVE